MCHVPCAMRHVPCAMCHVPCAMTLRQKGRPFFELLLLGHDSPPIAPSPSLSPVPRSSPNLQTESLYPWPCRALPASKPFRHSQCLATHSHTLQPGAWCPSCYTCASALPCACASNPHFHQIHTFHTCPHSHPGTKPQLRLCLLQPTLPANHPHISHTPTLTPWCEAPAAPLLAPASQRCRGSGPQQSRGCL